MLNFSELKFEWLVHFIDSYNKYVRVIPNMAIIMHTEISIAMHSTMQMKLFRAAIIQYNARNYVVALCYSNIRQTAAIN